MLIHCLTARETSRKPQLFSFHLNYSFKPTHCVSSCRHTSLLLPPYFLFIPHPYERFFVISTRLFFCLLFSFPLLPCSTPLLFLWLFPPALCFHIHVSLQWAPLGSSHKSNLPPPYVYTSLLGTYLLGRCSTECTCTSAQQWETANHSLTVWQSCAIWSGLGFLNTWKDVHHPAAPSPRQAQRNCTESCRTSHSHTHLRQTCMSRKPLLCSVSVLQLVRTSSVSWPVDPPAIVSTFVRPSVSEMELPASTSAQMTCA